MQLLCYNTFFVWIVLDSYTHEKDIIGIVRFG